MILIVPSHECQQAVQNSEQTNNQTSLHPSAYLTLYLCGRTRSICGELFNGCLTLVLSGICETYRMPLEMLTRSN